MLHYGFNIHSTYGQLPDIFYRSQKPLTFERPSFTIFNDSLAKDLALDKRSLNTQEGLQFLLGNTNTVKPLSMAYGGHQYGHFTELGDGRAHLIFEHKIHNTLYDVHLKGSGPTPFSRGFDGRATMRSALLEYLMSEALHALSVPTTRSLAVIKTGDQILRFGKQDAGVLVRIARSHIRVGTFELAVYKNDNRALKALCDYAIDRHDADLMGKANMHLKWFERVVKRQAKLIAQWQSIGFVHGVMNTDNMLISGETIDYGPCAFIDTYDLKKVFSSIDTLGRYAYGEQPYIASWNLAKLGEMIIPLIDKTNDNPITKIQEVLAQFGPTFEAHYYTILGNKLGIKNVGDDDIQLVDDLLALMASFNADYTNTWIALTDQDFPDDDLFKSDKFLAWFKRWKSRIEKEDNPTKLMQKTNPRVVPRNHLVKAALDKAAYHKDFSAFHDLMSVLKNPLNTEISSYYQTPSSSQDGFVTYCGT